MTAAADVASILRELVAIPTPSAVSNLPLLRWVASRLVPQGWHLDWMKWTDEAGVEKANLLAFAGQEQVKNHIDLAFVCHTDTVPYAPQWRAALNLEQREGAWHGCGACDVKGALACFLAAVLPLDPSQLSQRVALILTADEEVGCRGMERLLALQPFSNLDIGSAIVSEPTSLQAGIAGKGYGLACITVKGREAHSAFPQQGVSAISIAARLIARIEEELIAGDASEPSLQTLFDPPRTTVNIGTITGGTAKNIIAGECKFLVEWRPVPGEPQGSVLAKLEEMTRAMEQAEPRIAIRVEGFRDDPGFAPRNAGSLQKRLLSLMAHQPIGISFGSEASRIARLAHEVIVIGPGDMRTAHSDRECVSAVELDRWTEVLRDLVTGKSA